MHCPESYYELPSYFSSFDFYLIFFWQINLSVCPLDKILAKKKCKIPAWQKVFQLSTETQEFRARFWQRCISLRRQLVDGDVPSLIKNVTLAPFELCEILFTPFSNWRIDCRGSSEWALNLVHCHFFVRLHQEQSLFHKAKIRNKYVLCSRYIFNMSQL